MEPYLPIPDKLTRHHRSTTQFAAEPSFPTAYTLIPTKPDTEIELRAKGTDYVVKTYRCDHRIVCYGYGVWGRRRKLKPEFVGMDPRRIGALKREQPELELTTTSVEPLFVFLGDTTAKIWKRYPELPQVYPTVIVECTYLNSEDVQKAKEMTHMHWLDLKPIVEANPDTLFVLIHFSLKHSDLTIREFFSRYENVHPMIRQEDVDYEWIAKKQKAKQKQKREQQTSSRSKKVTKAEESTPATAGAVDDDVYDHAAPVCRCCQCRP